MRCRAEKAIKKKKKKKNQSFTDTAYVPLLFGGLNHLLCPFHWLLYSYNALFVSMSKIIMCSSVFTQRDCHLVWQRCCLCMLFLKSVNQWWCMCNYYMLSKTISLEMYETKQSPCESVPLPMHQLALCLPCQDWIVYVPVYICGWTVV